MEPVFALIPHLLIAIALLVGALVGPRWGLVAALPVVDAVLLAVYVFSEDTYQGGGVTRWEAYQSPGDPLGRVFIGSLVFLVACAGLLAYAAVRRRDRLFRWTGVAGAAGALFVIFPMLIAFSSN